MDRRELLKMAVAPGLGLRVADAAEPQMPLLQLPPPLLEGGMLLTHALKARRSAREFSRKPLPPQVLSNLLWAAFGVNRPGGGRTAPSARGWQEIMVYAAMENGLFRYDPKAHALQGIKAGDLRRHTGRQDFVAAAPLNLVYVADTARMGGAGTEDQATYAAADAGFISQNVYLCCAQEGLATVVRGWVDRAALAEAMALKPERNIMLAQTVGYPA